MARVAVRLCSCLCLLLLVALAGAQHRSFRRVFTYMVQQQGQQQQQQQYEHQLPQSHSVSGFRDRSIESRGPRSPVRLRATYGAEGPLRPRVRPGTGTQQQQHHQQQHHQQQGSAPRQVAPLTGPNVCGGQCCPGWSQNAGSQMCTKPVCSPPCQNGGMCVQPQACVCPAGKWGPSCAESNPQAAAAGAGGVAGQSRTSSLSRSAHMTLTVKHQPSVRMVPHKGQQQLHSMQSVPLSMAMQRRTSQPLLLKPKVFTHQLVSSSGGRPAHHGPNALSSGHGQHALLSSEHLLHVGNLSAGGSMGRIKVVFTPTICKMTCANGKCQNTCEKGNTTTLISENGEGADMLTGSGFRVVVCPIPCRNGGSCQTRDKCRCPANFTGKFCQIAVQSPRASEEQGAGGQGVSLTHSSFTVPVSGVHAGAAAHGTVRLRLTHLRLNARRLPLARRDPRNGHPRHPHGVGETRASALHRGVGPPARARPTTPPRAATTRQQPAHRQRVYYPNSQEIEFA